MRLSLLAALAVMDSDDAWVRTAILSSSADCAGRLFVRLASKPNFSATDGGDAILRQLAQVAAASRRSDELGHVWSGLVKASRSQPSAEFGRDMVLGLGDGLRRAGNNLASATRTDGPAAERLVARVMDEARASAANSALALDQRESAVRLLSHAEFDAARPVLEALINPREPPSLQLVAVRAISSFPDAQVPQLLLDRWRSLTPAARNEAVEGCLKSSMLKGRKSAERSAALWEE